MEVITAEERSDAYGKDGAEGGGRFAHERLVFAKEKQKQTAFPNNHRP